MNLLRFFCLLTLPLVLISGCNTPAENTTTEEPSIVVDEALRKLINEKNNILESLYLSGDIDSASTYFAENLIQLPPNAKAIKGRDAYVEEWSNMVATGTWKFDLEAQEVRKSGPMAVELGVYTLEFSPNENAPMPAFKDAGHYVVLWEKHGDDWKIVWDAPVSEVPLNPGPTEE